MYSMNRKGNFSIDKASYFEVKPTLWIALIASSLGIASSPDTIGIIPISDYFIHISWIKATIEKDTRLSYFWKLVSISLRNAFT